MSVLAQETRLCLSNLTTGTDGELCGRFVFPPEYPGFAGHFPGNPVLPGVCMIQAALVMQEASINSPVTLEKVVSAKWFAPVKPGSELSFVSSESTKKQDEREGTAIKTRITCNGEKVAELVLQVMGLPVRKYGKS
jgi:3-hydroxymyristoyl/3-hydroxydecanoyl-(acyl carrier protein) dehydratase